MANFIEKGDVFRERRREVQHLLPLVKERAPELLPVLNRLLAADWIDRASLRRVRWRWYRLFFSAFLSVR